MKFLILLALFCGVVLALPKAFDENSEKIEAFDEKSEKFEAFDEKSEKFESSEDAESKQCCGQCHPDKKVNEERCKKANLEKIARLVKLADKYNLENKQEKDIEPWKQCCGQCHPDKKVNEERCKKFELEKMEKMARYVELADKYGSKCCEMCKAEAKIKSANKCLIKIELLEKEAPIYLSLEKYESMKEILSNAEKKEADLTEMKNLVKLVDDKGSKCCEMCKAEAKIKSAYKCLYKINLSEKSATYLSREQYENMKRMISKEGEQELEDEE